MRGACESSELAELMAVEELADLGDQVSLADGKLRPGLFLEVFVAILDGGQVGADDQVLDQHLIGELLVAALDDDARRMALVGIFELVADVLRIAEIKFGADVGGAERRYHALVVGDAVAVEYGDDDRAPARSSSPYSTATASPTTSAWYRRSAPPTSAPNFISAIRRTSATSSNMPTSAIRLASSSRAATRKRAPRNRSLILTS